MTRTHNIIKFNRSREYKLVRELGQGACGRTVLIHDDQIEEDFVCKKYVPYSEGQREALFRNFTREIKLLHQIYHRNVVRIFEYYIYPELYAGYILMEFVSGTEIDDSVRNAPERINEVFLQVIEGFNYLESKGILHRDIRPQNLMVRHDGLVKIIDLGFGKQIQYSGDFDKSINLNQWCEPPDDFKIDVYDFSTEVYFIGKLFEQLVRDNDIAHFKYTSLLDGMCQIDPRQRVSSFFDVLKAIQNDTFFEIEFSDPEKKCYLNFADELVFHITKVEDGATYIACIHRVQENLDDAYRRIMLEKDAPDACTIIRCFIDGMYYYRKQGLSVSAVRGFLHLLKSATESKRRIILSNIHTRLDALPRYWQEEDMDIPF